MVMSLRFQPQFSSTLKVNNVPDGWHAFDTTFWIALTTEAADYPISNPRVNTFTLHDGKTDTVEFTYNPLETIVKNAQNASAIVESSALVIK